MEDVQLSDDALQTIATMVAEKLQPPAPAPALAPAPAPAPTDPSATAPVTMESMTALLKTVVENNTSANNDALFDTMFSDKLSATQRSIPGFSEFLDGEDDFGDARLEKLTGITDYTKRVAALETLSSRFKQASTHVEGAPHVTPAQQQQFDTTQEGYADVKTKFLDGEYKSTTEFTNAMLDLLGEELSAVS